MKIKALFEIEFPKELHKKDIADELKHFEETHDNMKILWWG